MPGYNSEVKNGADSVSSGKVTLGFWCGKEYPSCINHKAMLKVSKEGIWRRGEVHCSNGCFSIE